MKKNEVETLQIDYFRLMDLRVDFAFKLLFTKGDPRLLISLLNAIFANKKINRIVKSISIKNPFLDKETDEDKLSILDIRAELEDGTNILIEMHLHGLSELKSKTIRSWARAFAEEIEQGKSYSEQPPTIAIAFVDGAVKSHEESENAKANKDKIHRLCMIMDKEDYTVFTDVMELHYINMKAFAKAVNEADSININDTEEVKFAKWLSVITQKEINNKAIIEDAYKDEEDIFMAVATLVKHGEDKYTRQKYARRKEDIQDYTLKMLRAEQDRQELKQAEATIAEQAELIAQLQAQLADRR
jgi:predicted transposase/invertase (TIGR01784 family)